jgi:hypothetical protein
MQLRPSFNKVSPKLKRSKKHQRQTNSKTLKP